MVALAVLALLAGAQPITTSSLLMEMSDLERLTRRSDFAYRTIESSSYDRASTVAGKDSWFANADYGKYLRVERNEGREEFVMADYKGPGAVIRFWSANPMGTVRFYIDGEAQPRLTANLSDFLQGRVAPWDDRFSYNPSSGCNLYYPFPFSKSLKVTVFRNNENENLGGLYYQLNTRLYESGTPVESFSLPATTRGFDNKVMLNAQSAYSKKHSIRGGEKAEIELKTDRATQIVEFTLTNLTKFDKVALTDPKSAESIMNHIEVCWAFDGQETVRVPLPDFFGAGVLPGKLETIVSEVDGADRMTFRLPMPFKKNAVLTLVNHNRSVVAFQVDLKTQETRGFDYVLHGQWRSDLGASHPYRDMNFVKFAGEGRLVGTVLHVQNPNTAWWGEGDEKVFVDGETFPSWFGTGTEDYYGYAWCNPALFSRPYHGQARADGPANAGQVGNVRWHIFDDIPFAKSIQFDMEMWHWANTNSRFHSTAFWYAKPGNWSAPAVNAQELKLIEGVLPPKPIEGAIEGEGMEVLLRNGGTTEIQSFSGLSNSQQVWWKDAQENDTLLLTFDVPEDGNYRVKANQCFATDYGIHEVYVDDQSLGVHDFYSPELKWKVVDYDIVKLRKGKTVLRVTCRGSNAKSNPARQMFGLDYLQLVK